MNLNSLYPNVCILVCTQAVLNGLILTEIHNFQASPICKEYPLHPQVTEVLKCTCTLL